MCMHILTNDCYYKVKHCFKIEHANGREYATIPETVQCQKVFLGIMINANHTWVWSMEKYESSLEWHWGVTIRINSWLIWYNSAVTLHVCCMCFCTRISLK